jgi:demethylmenaquinone methyltransferase/2-methoxy-6-polyprenyl-1,4-benzoquinol methylase
MPGHGPRVNTRRNYDKLSRWYDLLEGIYERRILRAGVELLAPQSGASVLEVGFGTGYALELLAERVGPQGSVTGLDISDGMLAVTRQRLARSGLLGRVELVRADVVEAELSAGRFDCALTSFTLELMAETDIARVLVSLRRALKPGGRLCVVALDLPREQTFLVRLYRYLHRRFPNTIDCRPIPARRFVEQAGLRVLSFEPRSYFGLPVAMLVAAPAD